MTPNALTVGQPGVYSIEGVPFPVIAQPVGGGGGATVSLVWRPGVAPDGPNVFETFADLYAAGHALAPETSVEVSCDPSNGELVVTAGTFVLSGWTFVDWTGQFPTITFDTGAHVVAAGTVAFAFVVLQATGATTPFDVATGETVILRTNATVLLAGASPLGHVATGGALSVIGNQTLVNGLSPVLTNDADHALVLNLYGNSAVAAAAIGGTGLTDILATADTRLPTDVGFPPNWNVGLTTEASRVARATGSGLQGPQTGNPVSLSMGFPAIPVAGRVWMSATASFSTDADTTVQAVFQREVGNNIPGSPIVEVDTTAGVIFTVTLSWIDIPGDNTAHSYFFELSCEGANITLVGSGQSGGIIGFEL